MNFFGKTKESSAAQLRSALEGFTVAIKKFEDTVETAELESVTIETAQYRANEELIKAKEVHKTITDSNKKELAELNRTKDTANNMIDKLKEFIGSK